MAVADLYKANMWHGDDYSVEDLELAAHSCHLVALGGAAVAPLSVRRLISLPGAGHHQRLCRLHHHPHHGVRGLRPGHPVTQTASPQQV